MGRNVMTPRGTSAKAALLVAILLALSSALATLASCAGDRPAHVMADDGALDQQLTAALRRCDFTGRVESSLEQRLHRPIDPRRAELGRLLFFDSILGLYRDNACAACHSPTTAMAD